MAVPETWWGVGKGNIKIFSKFIAPEDLYFLSSFLGQNFFLMEKYASKRQHDLEKWCKDAFHISPPGFTTG